MKFAEELFPIGTFPKQQSDGAYIDGTLAQNLDVYAKKITSDMHFTILISGNDSVRNGKSTLETHIGAYLTWKINQLHGLNNTFTHKNIVMSAENLAEKSFSLPPYSIVCLDEGDAMTDSWMKESVHELKKYFRKCGQLNQILILILPSFFELPKFFSLSRSHALLNVQFKGDFDRGFFSFYGPRSKKLLYLKGKKDWDYAATPSDFDGRFFGSYSFFPNCEKETEAYKRMKYADMVNDAEKSKKQNPGQIRRENTIQLFRQVHERLPEVLIKDLARAFCISKRTASSWLNDDIICQQGASREEDAEGQTIMKNPMKEENFDDEQEEVEEDLN